jgi:UPF0271 protein
MDPLILNCDLGEDEPLEWTARLLEQVDAASIGCGVHAGSPEKTRATIELALDAGVLIGTHPGLPSEGGRGIACPSLPEFRQLLESQVGRFQACARALGKPVDYVKLHGTLYHAVEADPALGAAYIEFLQQQNPTLAVFALASGRFAQDAESAGLRVYHEAFADRAYLLDGSLLPRSLPGAVLSAKEALERFRRWREQGSMPAVSGQGFPLRADTLCVHGDSPEAIRLLEWLRPFK